MSLKKLWPILLLVLLLTGCGEGRQTADTSQQNTSQQSTTDRPTAETTTRPQSAPSAPGTTSGTSATTENEPGGTTAAQRPARPQYGYTYGQASGNKVVEGTGKLPESEPVDVPLDGVPTWVVGVPLEEDTAWVVALEDGTVQAFRLDGSGETSPVEVSPGRLAPGQPPLVRVRDGSLELVTSRSAAASGLTHPTPVSPDRVEEQLGVAADGQVFEEVSESDSVGIRELGITALPDARFVRGAGGTLAFLSDPTDRYEHDVLGDAIEAGSMTLLRPGEGVPEVGVVFPESGGVFEQISPLWFEVPGLDNELLAITESVPELGTRLSVYNLNGSLAAAGPYIGEPMKWRHLLAAGPFGPNGETELVSTLTPHLGGTIEFYRPDLENGSLDIVATQPGYTSHRIGSRNLDTARAGDLDGDGRWELLVPNDAYTELGAIRHEENGATVAWTLPTDGTIVSNLASATDSEGRARIAAGREDGVLRIWP